MGDGEKDEGGRMKDEGGINLEIGKAGKGPLARMTANGQVGVERISGRDFRASDMGRIVISSSVRSLSPP